MKKRKEKEITTEYIPPIHYESESIDVCRFCCCALVEENFHYNDNLKNVELLEGTLFNYSILKVLSWDKILKTDSLDKIKLVASLDGINSIISSMIPTAKQKDDYFVQYIYSIIFVLEKMNKRSQIEWIEEDTDQIRIILNNDIINKIVTPSNMPREELPGKLLKAIKNIYEKAPVLEKR